MHNLKSCDAQFEEGINISALTEPEDEQQAISTRGSAALQGAPHYAGIGSSVLKPSLWDLEGMRPSGKDFWHTQSQPSPLWYNKKKRQHAFGSDRPIFGDEMGHWRPNTPKSAISASTLPLDRLAKRPSFTQRSIVIISGTHGD